MSLVKRAFRGTPFIIEGWKLISTAPGLMKWAVIPFLIDLALAIVAFVWGAANASTWVAGAVGFLVSPTNALFGFLYWPLLIVFWIIFIVIVLYGTFLASSVVAAPFNSILAEKTLIYLGALPARKFEFRRWLSTTIKMFISSMVRSFVFLIFGLVLFVCSFIPVVNIVAAYLAFLLMVSDCMDYSLEVLELNFRKRLRFMADHLPEMSGMAGALALTVLVPGLTVLLLPAAVAGASNIVANSHRR